MATAVETSLSYNFRDEQYGFPGTAGVYLRRRDEIPTTINDARGKEDSFSLDRNGFEFHPFISKQDFPDDKEKFQAVQYPAIETFLKEKLGTSRVSCIDHLIRRQTYEQAIDFARTHGETEMTNMTVPAGVVHVDQSYNGAQTFLWDNFDNSLAEKLTRTRWAIVNVWRPLKTITRDPFGVCDGLSVPDEEFFEHKFMVKGPNGRYGNISKGDGFEGWMVERPHQPGSHKWWYWSGMSPDEVMLIKCFDSKKDGRCRRTPHCSFEDKRYLDSEPRTSVEVRCLVFWEDQGVD